MGEKNFVIWLSSVDYIIVYISANKGKVIAYVVKYVAYINGDEYEIARFDSGHNNVHMDVLRPDGEKDRVIEFPDIENKKIIDFAVSDFKANYDIYRGRFEKWLKQKD